MASKRHKLEEVAARLQQVELRRNHCNATRTLTALFYRPPVPEKVVQDGPNADNALTIKLDHSRGADQLNTCSSCWPDLAPAQGPEPDEDHSCWLTSASKTILSEICSCH